MVRLRHGARNGDRDGVRNGVFLFYLSKRYYNIRRIKIYNDMKMKITRANKTGRRKPPTRLINFNPCRLTKQKG